MKKNILTMLAVAIVSSNAHAIWVHDSTAAMNAVKQIAEAKKQLEQMKANVEQVKNVYKSLNGTRGVVDLLKNPLIIGKLPKSYQDLYGEIQNSKSGKWADLYKLSTDGKASKNATNENLSKAYDALVADYDMKMQKAFNDSTTRINKLSSLASQISITKDPKEIADLQARINAEQGIIALDAARFSMMKEAKNIQQEGLQQQSHKKFMDSMDKPFVMPKIHVDMHKPFSQ